ncbi:hypothetical protein BDW02DRAFT_577782 [Decorospora gaudefroyi]|uniref:NTF2-like protein n=1 Tax=Decorospora gaudefroyi TaxID=184978 RepID=A0A6A5KQP6_9PLEO|nr:hypothetical protein BDW02DRAFT_577782 [Decorospora gaudefroyi]
MTLRDTYARFLAAPSTGALAANASLHYVPTLTSINDATAIIKHLSVQEKLLTRTKQKVLDAIEGSHGVSVDVETTIKFTNGGGAYLPGLDDNFVTDRTVTFPMVHTVHFDKAGKITQMRQYWDQGSLLKQIDVIGARSRNWPIRDGSEQLRLIASNAAAVAVAEQAESRPSTAASRGADEVSISSRSRGSTNNAMNDPHASLSLFQPREMDPDSVHSSQPIAPRAQSAKPPPREYSELFAGADADSPSPTPQRILAKAGSGKNYKANRLFEETDEFAADRAPMSIKTSSKKYDHFTFGDDEDTPKARDTARPTRQDQNRSKNAAHWDFDDFSTPDKTKSKTQPQAVRHFGWSDDEVGPFYQPETEVASVSLPTSQETLANVHRPQEEVSPVRRPVVHKARPDADAHFEFVDDGTPEGQRRQAPTKGGRANKGQGLYEDHVTNTTNDDQDGAAQGDVKRALNDVTTTVKNKNRSKDFGSQWEMTDNSPGANKNGSSKMPTHETRSSMKTHWGTHQDSPEGRGINIAGNGMGGRKGTEAAWSLYDESPAKKENSGARAGIKTEGDGMGGRRNADKSFWDF